MRETFHHELEQLIDQLGELLSLVRLDLADATQALLDANLALATGVIARDVEPLHQTLENHALTLLARQQPVATDLRTILAALRISADLSRMTRLARHVAEVARDAHPAIAVPVDLRPAIRLMSEADQRIVERAGAAIATRDPDAAAELEHADDELDRLRDGLYRRLFDGTWEYGVEAAVEMALVGRYYERYADHAVAMARHVAFLAGRIGLDQDTPA
jgi:phosphate transport system protein